MEHHHNFLLYTMDQVHALVGVVQKIIVDKNQIASAGFKKLLISLIPVHSISQPNIAETTIWTPDAENNPDQTDSNNREMLIYCHFEKNEKSGQRGISAVGFLFPDKLQHNNA